MLPGPRTSYPHCPLKRYGLRLALPHSMLIMCRLCLSQNVELISLYPSDEINSSSHKILEIIERFTTVKIHPLDNLPQKICLSCIQTIQSMLAFQNKCKQNDIRLHNMTESLPDAESTGELENLKEELNESDDSNNLGEPDSLAESTHLDEVKSLTESTDSTELGSVDISKEILAVNVDDLELESEDETGSNAKLMRPYTNPQNGDYPRWKPPMIACDICGKLIEKYQLKYHINKHNGLKPFKCNEPNCTSRFSGPQYLSRHKRFCHSVKTLLYCDVCGRGFKVKAGLENHRSYHFDPKIPCQVCEKLFPNKRALVNHMLVHTQDRKYKCETCGKAYQTNYTLRIHKRVHTQEKPYSCPCGVSFAYKCLLKTHTEKYHK